ncbi:Na/Pi cotransporter family protein [Paracoccus sp. (in: a-proteobacteria)]|uniref:Na/Pi cotransporter family protein n=2 Tax=Paracoccus sp. TaxID=267 RepID=UPI0040593D30|nr:Na/Pi cotransporter family protein [Paracoccus sp. (in: a-proteobacteria)]
MDSFIVFFRLAGAVALLLFALRLVGKGMTDAFGVRLKMVLGLGTRTGPRAFFSGLVATLALQSSTATALMTASFVERDLVRGRMAQIALLGANVGTALTAWIVATGIEALSPLLLLIGYVMRRQRLPAISGTGLALIGVGLMLLSLTLLNNATSPLRDSPTMGAFLTMLDGAWPVAVVIAAALAAVCASSLAAIMLILTLGLSPGLTVAMVLGANLGGAIPPVLATLASRTAARRVTAGNLVVRALGCVAILPFAGPVGRALERLPLPQTGLAVEAHLLLNIALAAVIWPFSGLIWSAVSRLLPDKPEGDADRTRWLTEAALETPALALAGASREALAIGDIVQRMLVQTHNAFSTSDTAPLAEVKALDDRVDRRQQEVKTYLSRLGQNATEQERRRSLNIIDYVVNLEHVGDIIDRNLAAELRKRSGLGLRFSDAGYKELESLFLLTLENLSTAQTVFMTGDRALARQLMEVKVDIRNMERQSAQRHLIRLREGHEQSRQTSSLHLDILRDLKRINAHLVAVAHPILDEEGLLIDSRLKTG